MSHLERGSRRIRSIPPRTSLDVLREGPTVRKSVSREPTVRESDWSPRVIERVVQKPPMREKARSGSLYERDGKIKLETEVIEDYNGKDALGIILQFAGIGFIGGAPILRGRRNYGPNSAVFYTSIVYVDKTAFLILATRGDIFESQIVPVQMDINPFFKKELYLPQLSTTHDPTSMTIFQNNKLVTVGYWLRKV